MPKILPWSHSSLEGFSTCPRQYEELKVLKNFTDKKNDASIWGDEVHIAFEKYILLGVGNREVALASLPSNMTQYVPYLNKFLDRPGTTFAERKYGLSKDLTPSDFSGPAVWARGIIDVLTLDGTDAHVDDHKTGKNRKKDMQQLIVFALLVFYHHPEIETCYTTFHWLQLGATDDETFHRKQIPEMWATLIPKLERYKAAFDAGVFPPKPSGLCKKYCAVDTCEYHGVGVYRR